MANIQAHTQSLIGRIARELPRLGYEPMTPPETTSPIITFAVKQPGQISAGLRKANVDVAISGHRMRISPSVYNNENDVDRLLAALA